jgi:hypothetical protein
MAFRSVQVPAAAEIANRNPIVDFWKKYDNAVHSFVQVIASVAGRPGAFSARLDRDPTRVWANRAQFLDRARQPFGAGQDLHILLAMPPTLIVEESTRKPLLDGTSSTSSVPAALPLREAVR